VRRVLFAVALIALPACQRHAPPPAHAAPHVANISRVPKPTEGKPSKAPTVAPIVRDLDAINAGRTLNVIFTFNSTGYFIYRGQTMGYEYDLLTLFARESNLRLNPIVVRDSKVLFEKLNRGEGDVVAAALAATTNQTEVAMTDTLYSTAPVVVQRKERAPEAGASPAVATAVARQQETAPQTIQVRARLITTPKELAGTRVDMPRTSPYLRQLLELNDALNNDIDVVEVDESSDKLIQRLAKGQIAYTVAPDNLAALKAGEFTNIVFMPAIGPPQPIVWAVRRNAPELLKALNDWLSVKRKSGLLAGLYRKYFLDRLAFRERAQSQYLTSETGTLSPFDPWFREYAKIPGWDWRLIAAQAYQESHFNPQAHSWAGAVGLMQIMPMTARQMRINASDPRQSIEAACRYLFQFDSAWKSSIVNDSERIKFILASYNVGLGHVQDAVRLAEEHGDNPKSWDDVAYWLVRKSSRSVYNDPVVKHGFARGTEPVAYVDAILSQFANYKEFVTAGPAIASAP
jgi:membrane-bound lytic murein transglycosylase F